MRAGRWLGSDGGRRDGGRDLAPRRADTRARRGGRVFRVAAAAPGTAPAADRRMEGGDGVEPLRLSGHQEELGGGGAGGNQLLLFARAGRAGDDEGPGPVEVESGRERLGRGRGGGGVLGAAARWWPARGVPFHRIGDPHPVAGDTQVDETAGVRFVLGGHGREPAEDGPHPPARAAIAAVAGGAHAAVHHADGDAPPRALGHEVGPHLELGESHHVRAHGVQETAHHPGEVEGVADDGVTVFIERPRARDPGVGGAAYDHPALVGKQVDQLPDRGNLTYADTVDQHGRAAANRRSAHLARRVTGGAARRVRGPRGRAVSGRSGQVQHPHMPEPPPPVRPPLAGGEHASGDHGAGQQRRHQVEDVPNGYHFLAVITCSPSSFARRHCSTLVILRLTRISATGSLGGSPPHGPADRKSTAASRAAALRASIAAPRTSIAAPRGTIAARRAKIAAP